MQSRRGERKVKLDYRYRDKDTPIHRMNTFAKLAWVAGVSLMAVIFQHPIYLTLLFLATLPVIILADAWREWKSVVRFVFYMGLVIVAINALVMYHGSHVLVEFTFEIPTLGNPKITLEAICYGLGMALRLLVLVSAFTVLNFSVHPDDMLLAMIKLKLPYKSVLATSMSARFVPALVDDLERLIDVQRSRGLEMDRGKFRQRLKNKGTVLVPLLANSLDRTVQIAEAMESRAFGAYKHRTYYKEIGVRGFDRVALAGALSPLAFGIFLGVKGFGAYMYYPSLQPIHVGPAEGMYLSVLAALLMAIVPLACLRRRWRLD
jgi:energy-coupling factor transport system permease protein